MNPDLIIYVIVSQEFDATIYFPYCVYNDILRYYNVADPLHAHEVLKTHHTLAIL